MPLSPINGYEPLQALIVGCGAIAGGNPPPGGFGGRPPWTHAEAYNQHPAYRLIACVDPDLTQRSAFQSLWSVQHGFASLAEALQSGLKFDVVSLCEPTALRAGHLQHLLRSDVRAVICEKPLAADVAAGRELAAAIAASGKPVAVNFIRRWAPGLTDLKHALAAGAWGELRLIVGVYNKGLRHNGCHHLDLVDYLFGGFELQGVVQGSAGGMDGDPNLDLQLRRADGARFSLLSNDERDYALFDLTIYMERGRIVIDRLGMQLVASHAAGDGVFAGYRTLLSGAAAATGLDRSFLEALSEIKAVLDGGATLRSTPETALRSLEVAEAAGLMIQGLSKTAGALTWQN
jgi:predicted dehydrogenase